MTKDGLRSLVRIKLYEKTADFWTDNDIDALIDEEIRSLPAKNVYLEELWKGTTELNRQDYPIPTNTHKVEKLEINNGTTGDPCWDEELGWDIYGGVFFYPYKPPLGEEFRLYLKKGFTQMASYTGTQTIDIPDSKLELVVLGAVLRAYSALMGYFVDVKNWDYNAKPDGITMPMVQGWIRETKDDYKEVLRITRTSPKPRFINLVD